MLDSSSDQYNFNNHMNLYEVMCNLQKIILCTVIKVLTELLLSKTTITGYDCTFEEPAICWSTKIMRYVDKRIRDIRAGHIHMQND